MEIVLYQPEIAGNVGACIRLSANTGLPLNIIKPLGFNFQENKIDCPENKDNDFTWSDFVLAIPTKFN